MLADATLSVGLDVPALILNKFFLQVAKFSLEFNYWKEELICKLDAGVTYFLANLNEELY